MLKHLVRTLYNIEKKLLPKTGIIFCFTISHDIIIGLTQNYLRRYVFYQGLFFEVHMCSILTKQSACRQLLVCVLFI